MNFNEENTLASQTSATKEQAQKDWEAPKVTEFSISELTTNSCAGGDDGLGGGS
ncbi:MAG: hypothetical protein V4563_14715 [Pseudomonadota bacterium]